MARERIKETQPGRAHAGRRDAAHGRAHVPRQSHAAAAHAGGHGVVADRAAAPRPRSRRWNSAPSTSSPSRKIDIAGTLADFGDEILAKIRIAAGARVMARSAPAAAGARARPSIPRTPSCRPTRRQRMLRTTDRIIAIGASTGGTEAIREVLMGLPADCPAIVIAQHIPAAFSAPFTRRMDSLCRDVGVRARATGSTSCPATSTSRRAAGTCWSSAMARAIAAGSTTVRRSTGTARASTCCSARWRRSGPECRGRHPHRHGRRRRARPARKCATPARRPSRRTRRRSVVWGMPGAAVKTRRRRGSRAAGRVAEHVMRLAQTVGRAGAGGSAR